MSAITESLMTTEEMLALPRNDNVTRYLIRGQLRERAMTRRNRWHSRIEARLAQLLGNWVDQQPEPRGEIASGEAGCILQRNPDTSVGIDLVYFSPEVSAAQGNDTTMWEGIPTLVIEVLSPSDVLEDVYEKVQEYLNVGVPLVWLVDPYFQTVTACRPDTDPETFNRSNEITADPQLPGFRILVAQIFQR